MRILLTLLFLASFLPFDAKAGGPFDYPNCYIRYTYDATGLRVQRYYFCPPSGGGETDPPPGGGTTSSISTGEPLPRPAAAVDTLAAFPQDVPEIFITSIYPNPTKDKCTIVLSAPLASAQVVVYDIKGTLMHREEKSGQQFELQLSHLVAGQYFIAVFTPNGKMVFEITKL